MSKKGTGKKLTPEQEAEIFLNFSDGLLWSIEKVNALIQDKYQMTISQGCLHNYLKAHGITLKSYGFPGICESEQMKKWFLKDNNLEKIKEKFSSRYALYWMGAKDQQFSL